jgi:hypothetical protein
VTKKITDYNYFLPTIEALIPDKIFASGRNKPLLIRGLCRKKQVKSDYVVKFRNSQEMSIEASCRELLASFMAMQIELPVPTPVLVNISTEFIQTLKGQPSYDNASNSIGLNFGCEFMVGYFEIIRNQSLTENQKNQVVRIFPFDIFISNPDRRIDKPNLLTDGNNILIFDHELAFGFVFDIFKNKAPWHFRPQDKEWIQNHFFFPYLKNKFPDFSIFIGQLALLDDFFWEKALSFIPEVWKTEQVLEIKTYLQMLITNKDVFLQELQNVLFK